MMELLAKNCGYTNVSELFSNEVSVVLNEYISSESYLNWNKYSSERHFLFIIRYKFEIIMRNCKEGVTKFLPLITKILISLANVKHEPEVRMDNLILIEFM